MKHISLNRTFWELEKVVIPWKGQKKILRIFSVASATAFHKAISVVEFLAEIIGENPQRLLHFRSGLNEEDRMKFMKEIKGAQQASRYPLP